jgi:trigger factor
MSTSSGNGKGSKPTVSVGEMHGRMLLAKRLPRTLVLEDSSFELPVVEAPSLEGLRVAAPPMAPVTGEELYERFQELRQQAAPRRELARGEPVSEGHEVLLDVVGHTLGQLIPFSARTDWLTLVRPDPRMPGFFEALVGAPVGSSKEILLTFPPDYPVEAQRGMPARFIVEVKAARELSLPEEDSPEGLAMVGRGGTLEQVMQRIRQELLEERLAGARRQVREHVLDLLLERCEVEVPSELVDEELRRQWVTAEQPALQRWNVSPQELESALRVWQWDPGTRAEAERRLKVALVLGAIAAREKIQPGAKDLEEFVTSMAGMGPMSREEWKKVLASDRATAQRVQDFLVQVATTNHVMAKVVIG